MQGYRGLHSGRIPLDEAMLAALLPQGDLVSQTCIRSFRFLGHLSITFQPNGVTLFNGDNDGILIFFSLYEEPFYVPQSCFCWIMETGNNQVFKKREARRFFARRQRITVEHNNIGLCLNDQTVKAPV